MEDKKKIVFIGPPGVGKTTIKNVFFEKANPLNLLKNSIAPTRGVNASLFNIKGKEVGVFDLAGQENENWFNQDRNVFAYANLIICVLDVNSYLKDMLEFIKKIVNIIKEIRLEKLSLVILLHKIDLAEILYLQHKVKAVEEFVDKEVSSMGGISIYTTSISKKYFLDTYDVIAEILLNSFEDNLDFQQKSYFQDFRMDLRIILQYDDLEKHSLTDLFHDLDLTTKDSNLHLSRLEKLGFLELLESNQFFKLTERANFIKFNFDSMKLEGKESRINKVLESLYLFSNLKLKNDMNS